MKRIFTVLVAGLVSAFFMFGAFADKNKYYNIDDVCPVENQEQVLIDGAEEAPELLMAVVEGTDLKTVFERLKKLKMLIGEPPTDKMYAFESENHPNWVYVFFLRQGCIVDVKFTYKNLVEYLLTGDETLIRPEGA